VHSCVSSSCLHGMKYEQYILRNVSLTLMVMVEVYYTVCK